MKENLVSLAKLLATDDAFNLAFSSRGTDEEKYELAKTKFTDLTREDFSEFLKKLRETEKVNLTELSPDELEMVAGGVGGWATKLAAATMLITTLGATGVMSQQTDAMKGRHTGSSSGQTSTTQGYGAPQSVFTPVAPGRFEVIRADFQTQIAPTQPTQPGINPFIQRQVPARNLNIIKLMTPRSGCVSYKFDHGEEKRAQKIFEARHKLNLAVGSSSLIGELAQIVESKIKLLNCAINLGGFTFHNLQYNGEIVANAKQTGKYNKIIDDMCHNKVATKETAQKILENLSKPCVWPDRTQPIGDFDFVSNFKGNFSAEILAEKLFEGLDGDKYAPARKLVAVLLCECIRFNDDGAFVRWAMRLVCDMFNDQPKEWQDKQTIPLDDGSTCMPFKEVFTDNGTSLMPAAIFARSSIKMPNGYGGKSQIQALLNKLHSNNNEIQFKFLMDDFNIWWVENTKEFVSELQMEEAAEEIVTPHTSSAVQPDCPTN